MKTCWNFYSKNKSIRMSRFGWRRDGLARPAWRLLAVVMGLTLSAVIALPVPRAFADIRADFADDLTVDRVRVTSGEVGGRSIVRLRIRNDGPESRHLLAVETEVATGARLLAQISKSKVVAIESITIGSESVLDLSSSHQWIEMGPLEQRLTSGEKIQMKLVFVNGSFPVEAHVHDGTSSGDHPASNHGSLKSLSMVHGM